MKTKQQRKDEARKAYLAIKGPALETYLSIQIPVWEAYKAKIKEIDEEEEQLETLTIKK